MRAIISHKSNDNANKKSNTNNVWVTANWIRLGSVFQKPVATPISSSSLSIDTVLGKAVSVYVMNTECYLGTIR